MGEVYRARDTRLHRDVALKLPAMVASNPERMARFEREAQVLASLNHPNIASVYGLEESAGQRAIVMELVEGPEVRGPLPLDEALQVARQVAEAMETAHERGIIHRDLKPANIKLTPDGTVKVLDFGLAKALDAADESNAQTRATPPRCGDTMCSPMDESCSSRHRRQLTQQAQTNCGSFSTGSGSRPGWSPGTDLDMECERCCAR